MSRARNRHTNNTVIGAGECFIELLDADATKGERYLGDTPSGVLRIETEDTTVIAGDGPTPRTLARVVSNITRAFEVNLQDLSIENLALFVLGESDTKTYTEKTVAQADGKMIVKQGHWYQLGPSADETVSVGDVVKVLNCKVHSASTGGTEYTCTEASGGQVGEVGDYTLDTETGRLYIEPGKRISDGNTIYVSYTLVAQTLKTVVASAGKQIKAAFRYVEDAAQGRGNNYYAPVTLIRPEGDMALKNRTAAQSLTLNIEVLQPADGALAPLYINQQPA